MARQPTLRPGDLVVACQLAVSPSAHFVSLAESTGISSGECHNAVRRLRLARMMMAEERRPAREVLQDFLVHGAPFAFPPVVGSTTIGVPTAHSSPAFRVLVETTDGFVWPQAEGDARGRSLIPLFPGAPALSIKNPALYEMLTIIDALRVGSTRVRKIAAELLAARLAPSSA